MSIASLVCRRKSQCTQETQMALCVYRLYCSARLLTEMGLLVCRQQSQCTCVNRTFSSPCVNGNCACRRRWDICVCVCVYAGITLNVRRQKWRCIFGGCDSGSNRLEPAPTSAHRLLTRARARARARAGSRLFVQPTAIVSRYNCRLTTMR